MGSDFNAVGETKGTGTDCDSENDSFHCTGIPEK